MRSRAPIALTVPFDVEEPMSEDDQRIAALEAKVEALETEVAALHGDLDALRGGMADAVSTRHRPWRASTKATPPPSASTHAP